jgi:hypothetical protein
MKARHVTAAGPRRTLMKPLLLTAVASLTLIGAASASTLRPASPGCFNAADIDRTWGVGGPHTVYFRVLDRSGHFSAATYQVETSQACPAFVPPSRNGPPTYWLGVAAERHGVACHADEVRIYGEHACASASLRRLPAAETAALPHEVWRR